MVEFNTNHPVASSILYSIHEELVSLPEPSQKQGQSAENEKKENVGMEIWNLYAEVLH